MLQPNQRLPKSERLHESKLIQELFKGNSSSFFFYPFKILYLPAEPDGQLAYPKVLFVVPRKSFRRAHERNLIRRRLKEAYRLYKYDFFSDMHPAWRALAIVYVARQVMDFHSLTNRLRLAFATFKQSN